MYATVSRITKKGTGKTYYGKVAQHGLGWTTLIMITERGMRDIRRFSWRAHIVKIRKDME